MYRSEEQEAEIKKRRETAKKIAEDKRKRHPLEKLTEQIFTNKESWVQYLVLNLLCKPIIWLENFWETKLKHVLLFGFAMVLSLGGYEIVVNQKLFKRLYKWMCSKKKKNNSGIGDIAVQERLKYLEEKRKQQNKK
jgi:hypothetical protein